MVDANDSKSFGEIHASSTLAPGTIINFGLLALLLGGFFIGLFEPMHKIKHTATETIANGKRVEIADDTAQTKKSFLTLPFDPMGTIENILLDMKAKQEERKKTFGRIHNHEFDDYVYVREDEARYRVDWVARAFKEFLKKNDLRVIRLHDLRHT